LVDVVGAIQFRDKSHICGIKVKLMGKKVSLDDHLLGRTDL
jgi:uncharacterized protein YwbE